MSKFDCPDCETSLNFVSQEYYSKLCYDYTEETRIYYYKCEDCGKMYDEKIKSTGLRHLALGRYEKAENLALQPPN